MAHCTNLRVVEFFSGLGGFHCSLKKVSDIWKNTLFEVLVAFDINTTANELYNRNFDTEVRSVSIETIDFEYLESLKADIWLLSPPCQPYTRLGIKRDSEDPRASGLLHLIRAIHNLQSLPRFILLENVVGFETSDSRDRLVKAIKLRGYNYQEFHLTPDQFGIPNSRLRYFFVASTSRSFPDEGKVISYIPNNVHFIEPQEPYNLSNILEESVEEYYVSETTLSKESAMCFDIVFPTSNRSCCFTKNYSRFIMGTGSVIQMEDPSIKPNKELSSLKNLKLRFFTPREALRLHCFPDEYIFSGVSNKKMYQLIGNSLNVNVVAELIKFMLEEKME